MSIVLNQTPGSYYSAHGQLLFSAYEATKAIDPVTYTNYKYICDIYIGGNLITRQKAVPDPSYNRGVFDIGPVVRAYLETLFNPSTGLRSQQLGSGEFFISVTCQFGEEYADTAYTNLTTDSARVYYNHYNSRISTTDLSQFTNKVASSRPLINRVMTGHNCFVPYLPTSTSAYTVEVKTYGASGIIATQSTTFSAAASNALQIINCSPDAINAQFSGLIISSVYYYTVKIGSTSIYTFNVTCEAKYDPYTLNFLNKYGGFESFTFPKVSRKTVDIEKKSFQQAPHRLQFNGTITQVNSNNVYHEQKTVFASKFSDKLRLTTDVLTNEEYQWLGELFISPMIYLEDDSYYFPVKISATNYEYKKRINDGLTSISVELEFPDLNAQFR